MNSCSAISIPGDMPMSDAEELKRRSACKAADDVRDHMVLGLGTGSTVRWLIEELGARKDLKHLQIVSSSQDSARRAAALGLTIVDPDAIDHIDLVIDGVDQINAQKQVIKGGGGALVREKILAENAERVLWIMDASKRVTSIEQYTLPVEIVPFSLPFVERKLNKMGYGTKLRMHNGSGFISDNHNLILDVRLAPLTTIQEAHFAISSIAGVVETGYFHVSADCITAGTDGLSIW